MKVLVCAVLLFVLFSSGTTSDSNRYGDWFLGKLFFRPNVPPEGTSARLEIDSHGEKLNEIERLLKEVQLSVQENELKFQKSLKERDDLLQSMERSMKQMEDSLTGRYETLQDKLDELEQNQTSIHGSLQESVESFVQDHYESLQSTWMELENNITADSLQAIVRFMKELERNVKERDESQKGKLTEIEKQVQEKDNTLQEMMRNMTRLEDHSKVKHEELEAALQMLQNETEFIKTSSIKSCKDVLSKKSGTYTIFLANGHSKKVYCEQDVFGGGWIVFQHRFSGQVDFYRTWDEYCDGFGTIDGEFWLGLKFLHLLTSTRKHELMVEMKDYDGNYGYARYDHFEIGSKAEKFVLNVGNYSGTAGDSMTYNQGMKFSTKDNDNDGHGSLECANHDKGAWWYNGCTYANLNGPYGNLSGEKEMFWYYFKNNQRGMAYTRMMLREIN